MSKRESEDKELHDKAVKGIASKRFPFPNKDHPSWQTYLNEPKPTMGIVSGSKTLYPDIVVVDESKEDTEEGSVDKSSVEMLGEVETKSSVNKEEVARWDGYSKLSGAFFLYVPKGLCGEARRLSQKLKVQGFRDWKFDSAGKISIINC